VRKDLPIEQQIVQACHAAYEAGKKDDLPGINTMVVLEVANQIELLDISEKLSLQNIPHQTFIEPDINNETTALCTHALSNDFRKKFKKFSLWRLTQKCHTV
jgi:hypothetical protein